MAVTSCPLTPPPPPRQAPRRRLARVRASVWPGPVPWPGCGRIYVVRLVALHVRRLLLLGVPDLAVLVWVSRIRGFRWRLRPSGMSFLVSLARGSRVPGDQSVRLSRRCLLLADRRSVPLRGPVRCLSRVWQLFGCLAGFLHGPVPSLCPLLSLSGSRLVPSGGRVPTRVGPLPGPSRGPFPSPCPPRLVPV